jgi:GAF domain-containing protein
MPEGLNLRLLDVLGAAADALVDELDADACAISRVIGDVLILVTERVQAGSTLQSGQGYLVPDYPQTGEVLETRVPRTLTLDDADVDAGEAAILRGLGYGSLMMLPLEINGSTWGLVEVYRRDRRPFTAADVKRAVELSKIT